MPIQILPPEVAGKIAAGEVVERPASVVKELVENSIDAGADHIRVEIGEGGRRLMRIADDGCGIPAGELTLAFARHATSKLASVEDLEHIATLGFRGEALASVAAVSQVSVLTRPRDQPVGRYVRVDGGKITHDEGRGAPAGTIVTVAHLFHNVPARQKFLRQPETEAGHIYSVVSYYALAYPEIRFSLTADGRETFQSAGNGRLGDVLIAVYGLEVAEKMLPVIEAEEMVTGYVGTPALHRANRAYVTLYVNRRWIQDRSLTHAVIEAYHTLLPVGRYPMAVLFLQLPATDVDVNVHPTKREVKFHDGHRVFSAVQRAVRQTVVEGSPVPSLTQTPRTWATPDWERRAALLSVGQGLSPSQLAMEVYRPAELGEEPRPVGPVRLPLLRVVGQVGQTYVVAEGPQGMYLIDQHAAHERILFERTMADHGDHKVASQTLLEPTTLELDPRLAGTLAEEVSVLNEIGFDLEPFGGSTYLLRAVPAMLAAVDPRAALVEILETMRGDAGSLALQGEARVIAAVCKRAAVKAGQTLSTDEMQVLVRQLEQCESPRTCPHGRPTVLHLSVEQLEKEFARR